jgi:hypothetical protein
MGKGEAEIRISNAERDEAVSALGVHMSTGRLELAEYEERCGVAAVARTRGELEALFTDLPAPHPDLSSATSPTDLIRKTGQLVTNPGRKKKDLVDTPASNFFGVLAGICMIAGIPAAIVLTATLGFWWMFLLVGPGAMVFGSISDSLKKPRGQARG